MKAMYFGRIYRVLYNMWDKRYESFGRSSMRVININHLHIEKEVRYEVLL